MSEERRKYDGDAPKDVDEAIGEFLNPLNKGQYLLCAELLRQLGGEARIDAREFVRATHLPLPELTADASDGLVLLRLAE